MFGYTYTLWSDYHNPPLLSYKLNLKPLGIRIWIASNILTYLWATSQMVFNDPHLLVFMSLCDPLPLSVGWTRDLLLRNRVQQRWWMLLLRLSCKRLASVLFTLSCCLTCSLGWSCCPLWGLTWQGNEGGLGPAALRNWILPTTSGAILPPDKLWLDRTASLLTPGLEPRETLWAWGPS